MDTQTSKRLQLAYEPAYRQKEKMTTSLINEVNEIYNRTDFSSSKFNLKQALANTTSAGNTKRGGRTRRNVITILSPDQKKKNLVSTIVTRSCLKDISDLAVEQPRSIKICLDSPNGGHA